MAKKRKWGRVLAFGAITAVVHTVNPAPEEGEEAPAVENEPAESDFVDAAPAETEEKPSAAE